MTNEANWDRILRVGLGVVLLIVGFGVIGGGLGTVVGLVALVPLVTGLVGTCPLYRLFGIRTKEATN